MKKILLVLAVAVAAINILANTPAAGDTIHAQNNLESNEPSPEIVTIDTIYNAEEMLELFGFNEPTNILDCYKNAVPPEQYEQYQAVCKKVDRKAERLARRSLQKILRRHISKKMPIMGQCHAEWYYKKKILKEEYNIDWKSPQDLCPKCFFD